MGQGSETLSGMAEMAEEYEYRITDLIANYQDNKNIKVNNNIFCPVCGKKFRKKTKAHSFCSNKGRNNCKDRYWNSTDETRRERAKERR